MLQFECLIDAGETVDIEVVAYATFVAQELLVPSDIGASCVINDLRIGLVSQFVGPVPGLCFSEISLFGRLTLDPIFKGTKVILTVTNWLRPVRHYFETPKFQQALIDAGLRREPVTDSSICFQAMLFGPPPVSPLPVL